MTAKERWAGPLLTEARLLILTTDEGLGELEEGLWMELCVHKDVILGVWSVDVLYF